MKIIASLLLCFISILSFAQKISIQKTPNLYPSVDYESGNWIDTSQMYNSRYGPVATLTQDNMPCIMPSTPVKLIPNGAKRRAKPDEIPNLWKEAPHKYPGQPRKAIPLPQSLYIPK